MMVLSKAGRVAVAGNRRFEIPPPGCEQILAIRSVGRFRGATREFLRRSVISSKVFVGNLSFDATRSDVENLFSEAGDIVEVFIPADRDTGRPRGFAFVEFADPAAVDAAIEKFDGFEFQGRNLRVNEAEERRPRPGYPPGGFPMDQPPWKPKGGKSKGSRRNLRKRKRGF